MDVESCAVGNVVTTGGGVFDAEGEPTELAGVYEVHNGDDSSQGPDGSELSPDADGAARAHSQADPYGENPMKRRVFDREQYSILERYYDNGMNSTHRRNKDLVDQAAQEVGVSADKVKNWIGAETVRRKRQSLVAAGVKPSPGSTPTGGPPAKRKRSMSGYSLFLSETLKDDPEASVEHKTDIAQRWRNMADEERMDWHQRARLYDTPQRPGSGAASPSGPGPATSPPTSVEGRDRVVSYAVSLLQSCLERLDQVGVHSYCLLVDPIQMKTHTLASALGQQFHQQQQVQQAVPSDENAPGASETSEVNSLPESSSGAGEAVPVTSEEQPTETPMDTEGASHDPAATPESLSVYTAFSRFVLSSALAQQPPAASATAATTADSTAYQTAGHPHDATGVVVGNVPGALDMQAFNTGAVSSTLPMSLASPLGAAAAASSAISPSGNACRYQTADGYICPYVATSPHFLRAHRLDTGHIAKRGRPRKSLAIGVGGTLPANALMGIPNLNLDAVASMASLASAAATLGTSTVTTSSNPTTATPLEQQTVSEITVSSETQTVETTQDDVSDLSVDHMVMLVRNTFNAKYEAATGVKTVPYDDNRAMEHVVVYGLPEGVMLQRPKLYSPDQLRAIVKELDRVVFLPVTKSNTEVTAATELTPIVTSTAATATSEETVINNFVTSVDTLITETVPLNVVIESTPES